MDIHELYTTYFQDVYKFTLSLTKDHNLTEDIIQETFTRAYLNLSNFRNIPNKSWLFTVARNLYYDHLRKNKKRLYINYDFSPIRDKDDLPDEKLFEKENIQQIYEEIENLKENYRDAIIYYHLKEFSYKEAAMEMNITVANFKSVLFRARKKLKQSLRRKR